MTAPHGRERESQRESERVREREREKERERERVGESRRETYSKRACERVREGGRREGGEGERARWVTVRTVNGQVPGTATGSPNGLLSVRTDALLSPGGAAGICQAEGREHVVAHLVLAQELQQRLVEARHLHRARMSVGLFCVS